MGLRERLAAKTRRRAVLPIELGPLEDHVVVELAQAQAALVKAHTRQDQEGVDELQEHIADLRSTNRVELAFTALDPDVFEKVAAAYPSAEGVDGGMDWKKALPALATLCADDEDLRDEEYWTEQLSTWSQGERLTLWRTLFSLNTSTPSPYVPKG